MTTMNGANAKASYQTINQQICHIIRTCTENIELKPAAAAADGIVTKLE